MHVKELIRYDQIMYELGVLATVLGIIGGIPYIYNTYKKKTKPHRVAWIIFLILSIISFASQYALGARPSLIFAGWFVINNLILVLLSLRKNGGYGDVNPVNVISFLLAVMSIAVWQTTSSALLALVCVLIADGIGATLILIKSYKHPHTETAFMWVLGSVATLLNVLAVGKMDLVLLVSPIQIFLFNIGIVSAIYLGRKVKTISGKKSRGKRTCSTKWCLHNPASQRS